MARALRSGNGQGDRIFVAGHGGMVGSAIVRALRDSGVPEERLLLRDRAELDLTEQSTVREFFLAERPKAVYLAAAKVGGIAANDTYPADFLHENLLIQDNVIGAAFRSGVRKLLFLGSSCIYPKHAPQPIKEDVLLSGQLEPTNEPYAIAKICGIKLCESYNRQYGASHGVDYRSVMPTNLYGPGDNYHPENAHVIPGLMARLHDAKREGKPEIAVWGTGRPRREFLFVDDLAAACVHVMQLERDEYQRKVQPMCSHINVGYGEDVTIAELAELIAEVVGYRGNLIFDSSKPDGTPRKLLDSSLMRSFGWQPRVELRRGLELTYTDFCRRKA